MDLESLGHDPKDSSSEDSAEEEDVEADSEALEEGVVKFLLNRLIKRAARLWVEVEETPTEDNNSSASPLTLFQSPSRTASSLRMIQPR